jgi:hypothetical protein
MMATTSSLIHTAKATGGEHDGHGKVADPHVWPSCGGDEIEEKKRFKNTFAVAQAIILKEAQVFFPLPRFPCKDGFHRLLRVWKPATESGRLFSCLELK